MEALQADGAIGSTMGWKTASTCRIAGEYWSPEDVRAVPARHTKIFGNATYWSPKFASTSQAKGGSTVARGRIRLRPHTCEQKSEKS